MTLGLNLDRTLSSLTLLEEEPWAPFLGGMISLGRSDGSGYEVRVDRRWHRERKAGATKSHKNLVKNSGSTRQVLLHADGGGGWKRRCRG